MLVFAGVSHNHRAICCKKVVSHRCACVKLSAKGGYVGGQNRVDWHLHVFSASLKGVLGLKSGQNLGKIGSIWHIFPFLGPFFVLCLLAFGDTVSKCLFLLVLGKPPKMPNRPHFTHIQGGYRTILGSS